jgi:tetratricopeptide (TPR) repeat protein
LSLGFVNPAHAWRVSEELQQELQQKQAAVEKAPNDAFARFDLAITYAYTNHIQNGWKELKEADALDPGFRKKGLDFYLKKVTQDPEDWRLRFRLAFAYYFNEEKEAAIRELKNVLIIDPYNVWAYGYISLIYGEMGKVDEAMEYTRKGLEVDNNVAALHLLLAEGYYKKGDSWQGFLERMQFLRLKALGY